MKSAFKYGMTISFPQFYNSVIQACITYAVDKIQYTIQNRICVSLVGDESTGERIILSEGRDIQHMSGKHSSHFGADMPRWRFQQFQCKRSCLIRNRLDKQPKLASLLLQVCNESHNTSTRLQ
jgi:hypothetical protein